nr:hypothetical protein [Tanacetum cinerariifolium]
LVTVGNGPKFDKMELLYRLEKYYNG